ncbi:OLC1v1006952C1 [Oldenlandia corymbosa var. corymbosa]|uniref:OLC1v1006952C1 n=1 Tax=Oldenlandia corymbosa var. corymbosa TaxID=529605 RepID=A0AAV1DI96_OLDCO|nr:OLC1v1006952C1 [Oldenlandia corymbosa var. corymbosa]
MGCFLGCFGKSKDRRRRNKQRNKVIPRYQQRHGSQHHLQIQNVLSAEEEGIKESPVVHLVPALSDKPGEQSTVNSQSSDKPEEQSSSNTKKKVTFDANVTTYEHVSVFESVDSLPEHKEASHQGKEDTGVSSSDSRLTSEDDSVTSSVASYPPNHRYQNCRDSDDEVEECGDSELEDDDYDEEEDYSDFDDDAEDRIVGQDIWSESILTESMESRTNNLKKRPSLEEQVDSSKEMPFMPNQDVETVGPKVYARNRSDYVHPVLNPVENLTQWKTMKSKGTSQLKLQKENVTADFEAPLPFSSEPTFRQSSSRSKPKSEQRKSSSEQPAVDASLSTWLAGPESTPTRTTSVGSLESVTYEKVSSISQGSNSVRSFEDRPILGALTVEEIRQMSAASSPRKSPSRSPDEMPIIGTVGTYWNDSVSSKESRSASSYKGIPNTTSKYREVRGKLK